MMLFGGCDGLESVQQANTRSSMAQQEKLWEELSSPDSEFSETMEALIPDSLKTESAKKKQIKGFGELAESMREIVKMSEYTIKWNVRFGYIGIFIAIFYFLGGLSLLLKKSFSINLATAILVLDTLFIIAQAIVFAMDSESGFMVQNAAIFSLFGIVLNVILLSVIWTSDRSAF